MTTNDDIKEWLAVRKREALEIDPETAEVDWHWGYTIDPYGVYQDLLPEEKVAGRVYFALGPNGVWVTFHDLPEATRNRLRERLRRGQV